MTGIASAFMWNLVFIIGAGIVLGAFGQAVRAAIGLAKAYTAGEPFHLDRLVGSLAIGAIAGMLAAILFLDGPLTRSSAMAIIVAGYAGADAIEGMLAAARRSLPLAVLAIAVGLGILATPAPAIADEACHKPAELKADQYADVETLIYVFVDAEAQRLSSAAAALTGGPPWRASTVLLVYLRATSRAELAIYSWPQGCWLMTYGNAPLATAAAIFDIADVALPFGATFYRLPDSI